MATPSDDLPDVEVDPKQLEDYAEYLGDKQAFPAEVKNLVAQSDVRNESWGIFGIDTKQNYVELLNELQDTLDDMKNGFQSASEKFVASSREYWNSEKRGEKAFNDLLTDRVSSDDVGTVCLDPQD